MRLFLILLLALAVPAAAQVPDTGVVTLAPDAEARWIPYTLTPGNQPFFTAELDGQPIGAILDTGASVSMLSRDHAARLGRKVSERGHATAIGGLVTIGWAPITALRFGGLARTGGGLNVVALSAEVTGGGPVPALLIGRDLLDAFALEIDPVGRRFRLLPSGRMPFVGTRAPLSIGQTPRAYVTEVTIAGQKLRPIIVDTGDGTALTLARGAWRTLPLDPYPAIVRQRSHGAGGPVDTDTAQLPSVTIGQRTVGDVPTWVENTGGFSDQAKAAGRIGMGLLQRYRVLLDPAAGHMLLGEPSP